MHHSSVRREKLDLDNTQITFGVERRGYLQQLTCQITINDLPVGRSVDETLRLIDAFQFTDKYGEVCLYYICARGQIW
jgi:alkyl hydroperoxide reductase subunit AhpC